MNVNTSIRISKDILDKLREIAKDQNRSVNYVINSIISKDLVDKK